MAIVTSVTNLPHKDHYRMERVEREMSVSLVLLQVSGSFSILTMVVFHSRCLQELLKMNGRLVNTLNIFKITGSD